MLGEDKMWHILERMDVTGLEGAAKTLADRMINYFGLPEERRDVLSFGLTCLLLYILDILGIVLAGILVGALGATLVAALTFAAFRSTTGGAHLKGPWLCCLVSSAVLAACGALAVQLARAISVGQTMLFLATVAGLAAVAIAKYAPVDSPAKPIPQPQKIKFKRSALCLWILWIITVAALLGLGKAGLAIASGLGLACQAFSLTPGGAGFFRFIDVAVQIKPHH